jgi:hypothetical protein
MQDTFSSPMLNHSGLYFVFIVAKKELREGDHIFEIGTAENSML